MYCIFLLLEYFLLGGTILIACSGFFKLSVVEMINHNSLDVPASIGTNESDPRLICRPGFYLKFYANFNCLTNA